MHNRPGLVGYLRGESRCLERWCTSNGEILGNLSFYREAVRIPEVPNQYLDPAMLYGIEYGCPVPIHLISI